VTGIKPIQYFVGESPSADFEQLQLLFVDGARAGDDDATRSAPPNRHHVVLDSDLARLYDVTTGNFNKAITEADHALSP
jgi:hypothetical protein